MTLNNATERAMENKVVVVTGAGRGIGRGIALEMAAQGAKVVVNDAGVSVSGEPGDESPGEKVVAEIIAQGGEAAVNNDSVAEWDGACRIIETAMDHFGTVDCVVNNAGILRDRIFHKMSPEEFEAVVKVHLSGSFNVSRAAAELFREQKSGAFVHMTSASGLVGNFGQANYSAAKLGIVALSKSIALDMARYNVRSNCICPFAMSRMVGGVPADDGRVEAAKTLAPEKIAPIAVFLASDAAAEVNAQVLAVRRNEVFLMSQPRPLRSVHRGEGWTQETLASHMLPSLKSSFLPLDRSFEVFPWDPI